jgi:putative methanogen marker protein 4
MEKIARKTHTKVGIGDCGRGDRVKSSVEKAKNEGFADVKIFDNAQDLVSALKNGKVEAAVRGTLESKAVLEEIKSEFEVERILRIAFLLMEDGRSVLLAPVGVDEGESIEEKLELIIKGCELLAKFKVEPKVGVLSGGRLEDFGRHWKVDETLTQGENITEMALSKGIQTQHYGILLEDAFKESNIVIPPDGIMGNLIFRALHFFGGTKSVGAPVVNIDKVFVDTSRAKKDYSTSIALASALCGL